MASAANVDVREARRAVLGGHAGGGHTCMDGGQTVVAHTSARLTRHAIMFICSCGLMDMMDYGVWSVTVRACWDMTACSIKWLGRPRRQGRAVAGIAGAPAEGLELREEAKAVRRRRRRWARMREADLGRLGW